MERNATFFDTPERIKELNYKIDEALRIVRAAYSQFKRPVLLWSGGKDSMVLLWLLREAFDELPAIICWREPWMPEKQAFVNFVIQQLNLTVWDYAPSGVALCRGAGRIDVLNKYQIAPGEYITLARGTERPDEACRRPFLCGVNTFLTRPTGTFNFPWDLMLIGHKNCDVDPQSGRIPLALDIKFHPGAPASVFPLRHWTDKDILDYTRLYNVPHDTERYRINANGEWINSEDKRTNPDYYHTCFACCDPDNDTVVWCPKLQAQINNISAAVNWEAPSAEYCSLRTTKQQQTEAQ